MKLQTLKHFEYFCLTYYLRPTVELAREMNFTVDEINHIRLENPNSLTAQSFMLLKKWVSREGKNATSKTIFISENVLYSYLTLFPVLVYVSCLLGFSVFLLLI